MKTVCLSGNGWTLQPAGSESIYAACVPGSVYADLLAAGAMEDPFYRDNELDALALAEHDYIYQRSFDFAGHPGDYDAVLLRCEGLDTLCELTLNGHPLGKADNMHRIWEFDAAPCLQSGENTLTLTFRSPTRYIAERQKQCFVGGTPDAMEGFPHLRKAHCMFGWDWGPRLPDMGVWRDISLVCINKGRMRSVYVRQSHEPGAVTLRFQPEWERFGEAGGLHCRITVTAPDGSHLTAGEDNALRIENPALWYPRGYGAQPLYTVASVLQDEAGEVLDTWERRIGLRTMDMSREADPWGEEFCHMVNGVKIFAMGADYIPEDNILSRVTPERSRRLLEDAALANMNCIRIWGGGYYPGDDFYDVCDELGLLVWQDFMFACAMIELDDAMLQNIKGEMADNVTRLRHHASLGLWCGNNEMEVAVADKWYERSGKQYSDYIRLYEHVIPEALERLDPDRFYWPASPSSGGGFDSPNDENRGDAHYWEVWHAEKPFSEYRKYHFRYASEFGFQSFPAVKTIESFTLPEDRNIFSYVMEKHQRNNAANARIMAYMGQTFLYPTTLDALVYASQLLQAEAIRYGTEHWRRHRGRCMGAVYWQLNDCWPAASWSSVDYFGRWKALHYAARRFFAPVLLSCHEEGVMQNPNVNAQHRDFAKTARLNVSNETMNAFSGKVCWALRRSDASVIREGEAAVTVPPLTAAWLDAMDFADVDEGSQYLSYDLYGGNGAHVSGGTVLFGLPKHFAFADPVLKADIQGDEIVVTAAAYARSVAIDSPDCDLLLEDNYFDLNGGSRRVKILRGTPKTVTVRSVYDIR